MITRVSCWAVLGLFLLVASGCAGWRSVNGPPAEYIAKEKPDVVRLTLADTSWVLSRPTVQRDSVMGLAKRTRPSRWTGVPASEIRAMEVHSAMGSKRNKIVAGTIGVVMVSFVVVGFFAHVG